MALLDVNALIALAWDSHVHHAAIRRWFVENRGEWATCALTEAGFVRVSTNSVAIPEAIPVAQARVVLGSLRAAGAHRFLANDVSLCDPDVPPISGHRQVTDAVLLTLARRHRMALLTFDARVAALNGGRGLEVLSA